MPSSPAGNRFRDRARRIAVAALLVASAIGVGHVTARAAEAVDCLGGVYICGTITMSITGNGYAHAVDDQGGIDCYYNAGSPYGQCSYQYYWIAGASSYLDVLITVTANANSYACIGSSCSDAGGAKTQGYRLESGSGIQAGFIVDLAKTYTAHVSTSGDGSGTTTSSPAGLNCHYSNGAASGTCDKTWYFVYSLTVTFTATPAPGDQACQSNYGTDLCAPVNQTRSWPETSSSSVSDNEGVKFLKGHPIVTVGVVGSGTVTSTPAGISCPSTCSSYFAAGSLVSLSATFKAGYMFTGWSGACAGSGPICGLSLDTADKSATATFVKIATPPPTAPPSTPRPTATPRPGATATPRPSAGTTATATPLGQSPAPSTSSQAASSPGAGSAAPSGEPEASELTPTGTTATAPSGSSNPLTAAGASPEPSAIDATSAPGSQLPGMDPLAIIVAVVVGVALGVAGLGLLLLGRSRRRAPTPRS